VDFLKLLLSSSRELWSSIGDDKEKYLSILRRIAIDFTGIVDTISNSSSLIEQMRETPILVATKKDSRDSDSYHLASAREIFINDNKLYQHIFNQLTAPEEDSLEMLYKKLGCKSLQESVEEKSTQKGNARENEKSRQLQESITERASLFYFNHPENKKKENQVIRDEKWLKELKVREIDHIDTTYKLITTNDVRSKRNKICILQDSGENSWTLYMSPDSFDVPPIHIQVNFDISQHIIKSIYKSHEWKDIFYLSTLLTTPLEMLRGLGYPVDRRN